MGVTVGDKVYMGTGYPVCRDVYKFSSEKESWIFEFFDHGEMSGYSTTKCNIN